MEGRKLKPIEKEKKSKKKHVKEYTRSYGRNKSKYTIYHNKCQWANIAISKTESQFALKKNSSILLREGIGKAWHRGKVKGWKIHTKQI